MFLIKDVTTCGKCQIDIGKHREYIDLKRLKINIGQLKQLVTIIIDN